MTLPYIAGSTLTDLRKLVIAGNSLIYTATRSTNNHPPSKVVVKIPLQGQPETLYKEYHLHYSLRKCPHIVSCLGYTSFVHYNLVMEYMTLGSLATILWDEDYLELAELCRFLFNILAALIYLHNKGIAHLDLKPDNIFVGMNGDQRFCKLGDLGLAKSTFPLTEGEITKRSTFAYMSPEQFKQKTTPTEKTKVFKCDIFALAMVLYEMITCRRAYEDLPDFPNFFSLVCH